MEQDRDRAIDRASESYETIKKRVQRFYSPLLLSGVFVVFASFDFL